MNRESEATLLRLEPQPGSVGEARRLVRRTLAGSARQEVIDTAALVVSELVTNAVVHAGTSIEVSVHAAGECVRVEIADGSPHLPTPRGYAVNAGTGRGIVMVEQLVDDWGVLPRAEGKVVWFELGCGGSSERTDEVAPGLPRSRQDLLMVHLVGVPVLLHAAWQQHADALLRERLLSMLDTDDAEDALRAHAEASDALALLSEHLPHPDLSRPDAVVAAAVDPGLASVHATVPVPVSSVGHFAALSRSLDQALRAADRGGYLTPTEPPQMRELRRWLCREVHRQSQGLAPEPWTASEQPPVGP